MISDLIIGTLIGSALLFDVLVAVRMVKTFFRGHLRLSWTRTPRNRRLAIAGAWAAVVATVILLVSAHKAGADPWDWASAGVLTMGAILLTIGALTSPKDQ